MPKLFNFASQATQLRVTNKSVSKAEIILYAGIGQDYWGDGSMVSAKQFSDELKKIDATVDEITVRINSPGGDVFDGVTIYNRLKQHKAKKIVYIDGLAASIASIIALAGDEIHIGDGAMYMVHLPWTFAFGNRKDLDSTVARLMDVEEQMLGIYAKKTKMDRSEIRALLEAETWMGADDAIEYGFVDSRVEESIPIAASAMKSCWFTKKPTNFKSQASVVNSTKSDLVKKIQERIARK